jgi:hypothetical protein
MTAHAACPKAVNNKIRAIVSCRITTAIADPERRLQMNLARVDAETRSFQERVTS